MSDIVGTLCNTQLTIKREQANPSVGTQGYGGDTKVSESTIMDNFPASVLQGSKGEKSDLGLPDQTRQPWYSVLMPAIDGVAILTDDLAYDADGNRYKISSCELSNLGWRLSMMYSQP
ncbi:hypothetical protein ACELLULO517_15730 [Acidisoma cellulosilytica]|uniref:Uncharacterized protein n=1 Tax=Acidisoma cellulosilyticum TaxID=2802395 RepID=A0A963Z2L4_9PROT|nr:hypothetical protein [Acidisoma cellulosilyticum]MCB8881698.1 hypothetical protein [Acidisoma cellulosilyticum]